MAAIILPRQVLAVCHYLGQADFSRYWGAAKCYWHFWLSVQYSCDTIIGGVYCGILLDVV